MYRCIGSVVSARRGVLLCGGDSSDEQRRNETIPRVASKGIFSSNVLTERTREWRALEATEQGGEAGIKGCWAQESAPSWLRVSCGGGATWEVRARCGPAGRLPEFTSGPVSALRCAAYRRRCRQRPPCLSSSSSHFPRCQHRHHCTQRPNL